ncbi:MAG TPA: ATP-binding protein [Myxococcales bacterium LLY-WYZ-16_1]|jgi:serine/threonine-protein kinase RsbW|nr:ATP-binding protein [Myxococcales bacterium LLY-WYZ-16_1]
MGRGGHGTEERFSFQVPARLEFRDAARSFLEFLCQRLEERSSISRQARHHVTSAFVEAFNNAVVHAYRGLPPGQVEVHLVVRRQGIEVRIIDWGHPFEFDAVAEPDLDALPEGGLGLYIIRQFMDDVRYEADQGRNVLTMRKAFGSQVSSA